MARYQFAAPPRRRRSPAGLIALLVLVLAIGFLLYLGFARRETPLHQIEQDVTNDLAAH